MRQSSRVHRRELANGRAIAVGMTEHYLTRRCPAVDGETMGLYVYSIDIRVIDL